MEFLQSAGLSNIASSVVDAIPLDTKKALVIDQIAPFIKKISPKWGEKIIEILKSLDISKLLPLVENDKELEKKVKDEESKLEAYLEAKKQREAEQARQNRSKNLMEEKKRMMSSSPAPSAPSSHNIALD